MAFEKGISGNPAGRPVGSKNKAPARLRELITAFLEQRFEGVVNDFELLEPKDRIRAYLELLQYGVPKLQAVSTAVRFEDMTDDQLDEIMHRLLQNGAGRE